MAFLCEGVHASGGGVVVEVGGVCVWFGDKQFCQSVVKYPRGV